MRNSEYAPDMVVNTAAYASVDKAKREPELAMTAKADGPKLHDIFGMTPQVGRPGRAPPFKQYLTADNKLLACILSMARSVFLRPLGISNQTRT